MANFNSYLERMDLDFWREMCREKGTLRHYEPGDCFLEAGSVARYMGYVERGTLKYVATDSRGNGHVFNFEFPGGFVASFPDSIYNRKSKYSVIANSDCDIWCLPIVLLRERLLDDKDFELVIAKTSEHVFGQVYDMLLDSYRVSPKQRYEQLIAQHPEIFESFQLKDVASFLRIIPTHLSRLRKK